MKNLSDNEIISSILKGNPSDFTLLIDRYKNRAFSLLVNLLKNRQDAEEALQDSFLKTYNSLNNFHNDSKFSTWFYRIVYNTGLTILASKKRKIENEMNSIDDFYSLKEEAEVYARTENAKDYILSMVDKLPIRNSLILILFYMDNLSLKDISEVLDISIVNTKVLLYRSRNLLRELLIKHNYQEELRWKLILMIF